MPTLTLSDLVGQGLDGPEAIRRLLLLRHRTLAQWARRVGMHREHVYATLNQGRSGDNVRDALAREFSEPREYIDSLLDLEPAGATAAKEDSAA